MAAAASASVGMPGVRAGARRGVWIQQHHSLSSDASWSASGPVNNKMSNVGAGTTSVVGGGGTGGGGQQQ